MRAHHHRAPLRVGQLQHVTAGVGQLRQHSASMPCEGLPEDRWTDTAGAAVVKRHAKDFLDVLQRPSGNRLSGVKFSGRPTDRALPRQRIN